MTAETKKKKPGEKKTRPHKKIHRKMLELTIDERQQDLMVNQIVREQKVKARVDREFRDVVEELLIKGIIEPANAQLPKEDQQDTLTFYSGDGQYRIRLGRQNNRSMDGKSHMAKTLIADFLNEYRTVEFSKDLSWIISQLEGLFFGSGKKFKWTPELHKFLTYDTDKLPDDRLKKAQKLLIDSIKIDRSQWYVYVEEWNEKTREYEKIEA